MKRTHVRKLAALLLAMVMATGCMGTAALAAEAPVQEATASHVLTARGVSVATTRKAALDYSDADDGYVMVRFTADAKYRLKCQVTGPDDVTYTYNLTAKEWAVFPLSAGNGSYAVAVYEETGENTGKYYTVLERTVKAQLDDGLAPFLLPNQYVDYGDQDATIAKAGELVGDKTGQEAIDAVYGYVVNNLAYDHERARTVKSGYLPSLDEVLEAKKGICFDYAALMAAMLRSQGVPCKLVVGYAGTAYHAWVQVWNGEDWVRMDPTFASSGNQSEAIMAYIGDGSHYRAMYTY